MRILVLGFLTLASLFGILLTSTTSGLMFGLDPTMSPEEVEAHLLSNFPDAHCWIRGPDDNSSFSEILLDDVNLLGFPAFISVTFSGDSIFSVDAMFDYEEAVWTAVSEWLVAEYGMNQADEPDVYYKTLGEEPEQEWVYASVGEGLDGAIIVVTHASAFAMRSIDHLFQSADKYPKADEHINPVAWLVVSLIGHTALMIVVLRIYEDAMKRYVRPYWPAGWAVAVYVMLVISLPAYFVVRPRVVLFSERRLSWKKRIAVYCASFPVTALILAGAMISKMG